MYETNKNARLSSRLDKTGKVRTETVGRDRYSVSMAASTDVARNSTRVYIDDPCYPEASVRLSGRSALTLYKLLQKHYEVTGKASV